MDLQDFLRLLHVEKGPGSNGEYLCRCPAHDDRTASLSVKQGDKGILLHCHAGCASADIVKALGLEMKDLFAVVDGGKQRPAVHTAKKAPEPGKKSKQPININSPDKVYDYTDENGGLLFQVCRYDLGNGEKTFRQRVPDQSARGGYRWSIKGVRNVPYRLPEVIKAIQEGRPVFIVEGEKDADNMEALGFTATTNAGGASKDNAKPKWRPEHSAALTGADVYILPDNDETGKSDRQQVATWLVPICKSVRLLDLTQVYPDLPVKGDITDFFHMLGKQKGLEALRQLMEQTSPLDASEINATADRDAAAEYYAGIPGFCVEGGCICQWSDESPKRLATFIALPRAVVTRDDGVNVDRLMMIDGWDKEGNALPQVRVAAKNFKSMGWVLENWEFRANIMPGNTTLDKLRYVIAEVGNRTAVRTTEYTHTGWRKIGDSWAYLYQGGAIGAAHTSVDLGSGLQAYRLDGDGSAEFSEITPMAASAVSIMLTSCLSLHISIPLLALAYLAPLREPLAQAGYAPAFSTFLVGESGCGKSTAAALALSHFGNFTSKNLPASFHDTSNYIQKKAFLLKDTLIVVDDYHPSTSLQERRRMEASAQNLSRAFGDNAPRNRMNSDTTLREATPPRCISLISGEDMPDIGTSGLARYYIINVEASDMPKDEGLTDMQDKAQAGYLQRAMRGYIEWLAPQMDELPQQLSQRFKELRTKAQAEVKGHARTPEAIAHLMLGYEMMIHYMVHTGFFDDESAETLREQAWITIAANSDKQGEEAQEERPGKVFLATLSELLVSKRAMVRDLTDPNGGSVAPAGMIGYMDANYYYLLPDIAFATVSEHTRKKGQELPLSLRRLYKQMQLDGLLEIDAAGKRSTRVKNIDGKSQRLLWIPRRFLDGASLAVEQIRMDPEGAGFVQVDEPTPFDKGGLEE
ncbi:DUF927 domain-containing protein [Eubacteriales bacterium OttesenSCG-928-A19]|nr:DUF927 domain-containing protein [Eubacteriales bacterium OttesenSCG-928-A19]